MPDATIVPVFIGLDLVDAQAIARATGVTLVSAEPDGALPVTGVVAAQEPPAGTEVRRAQPVAVTFGGGPPRADTPSPTSKSPVG